MIAGTFVGLDAESLATLKTNVLTAINAILTGAQSYSMSGRSFTKADLGDLQSMMKEITYAQQSASETLVRNVHNDMSNP